MTLFSEDCPKWNRKKKLSQICANNFLFEADAKRKDNFHYSLFLVYANKSAEEGKKRAEKDEEKLNFI